MDGASAGAVGPVEWTRRRWRDAGQPEPDYFAGLVAVLRLSQQVGSSLDRSLREHNMSRTSYLVLSTLMLPSARALTMTQLSKNTLLHATTISLTTNQLEKAGFVARRPHPSDRRTTIVGLTSAGISVVSKVSGSLSQSRYGFDGASDRLVIALTEIVRQVAMEIDGG